MKSVSAGYKSAMNELVRPMAHIKATYKIIDSGAEDDATVSANDEAEFCDVTDIMGGSPDGQYATFEPGFMKVQGRQIIVPDTGVSPIENGYVSDEVCGTDGFFANRPILSLTFSEPRDIAGVSFTFDTYENVFPTKILLTSYLSDEVVQEMELTPTSASQNFDTRLEYCDTITFAFVSMSRAQRRVRILNMGLGLVWTFETCDVITSQQDWEIDPISTSLPSTKLTLRVQNFDKQFNADNPSGIWAFMSGAQPMEVQYGIEVGDDIEWLEGGHLFLEDAPTTDSYSATFTAVDIITTLTGTYYKGAYRQNGISLYDLAELVLADAGVTNYVLADSLQNVITMTPMPVLQHRECLQVIANAGRCCLYTNAAGAVVLAAQIDAAVTLTDSGHEPWSDVQRAYDQGSPSFDYVTFTPGSWTVNGDGKHIIVPDAEAYAFVGFVSSEITGADKQFATGPSIYITFSLQSSSAGFSITFDDINGIYATDFQIVFKHGTTVVQTVNVEGNTEVTYTLDDEVIGFDRIEVTFLSMSLAYSRCKVSRIGTGRVTDYYLDYSIAMEKPPVKMSPSVKNVEVAMSTWSVGVSNELYRSDGMIINGTETIRVTYAPAINIIVSITGGTLDASTFYAETGFLTITASGSVEIVLTGTLLLNSPSTITVDINPRGESCPLNNPLITNRENAVAVGRWVGESLKLRNSYELPFRQDFRLEANDVIYFKSEFEDMFPVRVSRLQINMPSQKGAIKCRRLK